MVTNAAESVRDYANRATEVVKDQYGRMNKQVESGLEEAQDVIAVCIAIGGMKANISSVFRNAEMRLGIVLAASFEKGVEFGRSGHREGLFHPD